MNFARCLWHLFYSTPPGHCFCFTKKYFTDKTVKNSLRIKKKWKQLVRKTKTHAKQKLNHYLHQHFISFYYWQISLFFFSLLETMQSRWGFFYDKKKCFIWVFSSWDSKNPLEYLKLKPSNLFNWKVWCKIKILKFENKNAWFASFWAIIWKCYCHIWNPRICLVGL